MIALANAPVSYGVFGLSRPDVQAPDGEQLASWVAEAGYTGIDLGEPGLLGRGDDLVDRLRRHGLGLAGGWIDFPFTGTDAEFEQAFAAAADPLDLMALAAEVSAIAPKPTLADSGDAARTANPGGGPELFLDDAAWSLFAARLARVADLVRSRGLEPTFHHHAATYVETPEEIDRFLQIGDVDLTFDTGHLLIGGGDPVPDLQRWLPRINHIHLKDADLSIMAAGQGAPDPIEAIWSQRVFTPFGQGDLDIAAMVEAILAADYEGWIVVEQDVIPTGPDDVERARADQVTNREVLRRWFA